MATPSNVPPLSSAFHMLSVTAASTPCLMDFQMQVDDFFQDLTGIFLCALRWRSGMSGFSGAVERFCIQSTNIFPLILSQKAKCDASCTFLYPANKRRNGSCKILREKLSACFPKSFPWIKMRLKGHRKQRELKKQRSNTT